MKTTDTEVTNCRKAALWGSVEQLRSSWGLGQEPLPGTWGHIVNSKLSKIISHTLESGRYCEEKGVEPGGGWGCGEQAALGTGWSGWASLDHLA